MITGLALTGLIRAAAFRAELLAPVDPTPTPTPTEVNLDTNGIVSFFATNLAPIPVAVLGLFIIVWGMRGRMSQAANSTIVALLGVTVIASAGVLFAFGDSIIDLMFGQ